MDPGNIFNEQTERNLLFLAAACLETFVNCNFSECLVML